MKSRSMGVTTTAVQQQEKSKFDLNDCEFKTFSVEVICRLAKASKTSILVLSSNRPTSEARARSLYAVLARQIREPYHRKIVMKNGTVIRFIEDYDQLGNFEPEHVFE